MGKGEVHPSVRGLEMGTHSHLLISYIRTQKESLAVDTDLSGRFLPVLQVNIPSQGLFAFAFSLCFFSFLLFSLHLAGKNQRTGE